MSTDVLAAAGYEVWAIVGMCLFILAFASICIRVALTDRREFARLARLPLDEETPHGRP